jgi:hypothetical protein
LQPSKAIAHWLSWRSSSTSTPIRSHHGKRSSRAGAADVFGPGGRNGATQPAISSLRRLADVARPAGGRGVQDRPSSREDADAADGDRGALSPSPHHEAGAGKIYPYLLRGMETMRSVRKENRKCENSLF